MTRYKERYRIESTRLSGWDYASPGYYFVTIVTRQRCLSFGDILNQGEIRLSPLGEIARRFWVEIPSHFANTTLDEFVVMPNHIHGIVIINEMVHVVETPYVEMPHVETPHVASLPRAVENESVRKFGPLKPGSLSKIIQAYKSAVSRWAGQNNNPDFAWQPGFFDHVIRDQISLNRIRAYIRKNPQAWAMDEENPAR